MVYIEIHWVCPPHPGCQWPFLKYSSFTTCLGFLDLFLKHNLREQKNHVGFICKKLNDKNKKRHTTHVDKTTKWYRVTQYLMTWVFPKIGIPQNGWFIMEIPIKWMIWGYPYFRKHPPSNYQKTPPNWRAENPGFTRWAKPMIGPWDFRS